MKSRASFFPSGLVTWLRVPLNFFSMDSKDAVGSLCMSGSVSHHTRRVPLGTLKTFKQSLIILTCKLQRPVFEIYNKNTKEVQCLGSYKIYTFHHRRTGHLFFLGGGREPIAQLLGGRISRGTTMVGAERENFEHLEPLDCQKRRFQRLNSTFLVHSFRCMNEGCHY